MTTPDVGRAARRLPVPDMVGPAIPLLPPPWLGVTRHSDVIVVRIAVGAARDASTVDLHAVAALLATVRDDPTIAAIVLTGASAFADVADVESRADGAAALTQAVEESRVGVVAAISGSVVGQGLDLALACRFRVASASARLGLPAIRHGVLPATGIVRRLATLLAPTDAVELLAYGTTLTAETARRCGLVDCVADGPVLGAAIAFAMRAGVRPPRPKAGDAFHSFAALRARAERRAPGQVAPLLAIEAVEHATRLPAERSLAEIARLADMLRHSDQGRALRYARDVASRVLHAAPQAERDPSQSIRSVCMLEPGDGGRELASLLASCGVDVVLSTATPESADVGVGQRHHRLRVGVDAAAADLLIVGPRVTAERLDHATAALPAGARLAASPNAAQALRASAAILLHPYSPAQRVRLVELVGSGGAADDVAILMRRTGLPVLHRPAGAGGVLVDRLRWPMLREAIHLLDEGATPLQVDTALVRFGFAVAPLAALDREGLDGMVAACVEVSAPTAPWHRYSPTLDMLHEAGRKGAAVGSGWYRYAGDTRPLPDPAVDRLLRDSAMAQRLRRRTVPDTEIVERCLFAATNAAASALEDGAAGSADVIDAVWTAVLGFPRWRGGLLYHADRIGLPAVVAGLRGMQATVGQPAALLVGAAEAGAALT